MQGTLFLIGTCEGPRCTAQIPSNRHFCPRCWGRLSPDLRAAVTDAVIDFRTAQPRSVPKLAGWLKMARRHLR